MKAKDLIKILEKNPEHKVTISCDVSTEEDNSLRVFGEELLEVVTENHRNQFTLLFEGIKNH